MLSLGPQEIVVILLVVLMIFGPSKLPEVIKSVFSTMRKLRQELDNITSQIDIDEITKDKKDKK
ncbi:MAG: twin-arginine translocase TatA/TatE family subunit [Actinobacteria bacterium]|nr:MAG: twin-arginine translocase TatA/TatE family subunit [Actinomycetota bacterium]